jgi:Cupin-like domain
MGMGNQEKTLSTGSPLHCARHANFFIQVVGSKKWTLIEPKYSLFLHPILAYNIPGCISETLPSVTETLPRQEVILNPGDVLFNPPWMWHQVENMPGFTIGCATRELRFWGTLKNNPMFTILQEFTEMNSHFSPRASKSPIHKFLVSLPFFVYGLALLQESIRGYVNPPIRAYAEFDEHHSESKSSFDYLEKIQEYHQNQEAGGKAIATN